MDIKKRALQAIVQAVGTVPNQIEYMSDLTEEEKDKVNQKAHELVVSMLFQMGVSPGEVEEHWGL